jgi:hypothetical protein
MGRLALGWLGDRKTRRIGNLPPKVGGTTRAPAAPARNTSGAAAGRRWTEPSARENLINLLHDSLSPLN